MTDSTSTTTKLAILWTEEQSLQVSWLALSSTGEHSLARKLVEARLSAIQNELVPLSKKAYLERIDRLFVTAD